MARRRRRRSNRTARMVVLLSVVGAGFFFRDAWLGLFTGGGAPDPGDSALTRLISDRPQTDDLSGGPNGDVPERASDPLANASSSNPEGDPQKAGKVLAAARRALADGDVVLARAHFSEALNTGLDASSELEARTALRKLGRATIFSSVAAEADPSTEYYVIAPGDTLHKIAKAHKVTAEFLARINNISDVNRIRAGRRIKVVHGPFHARVTKATHTLDVFCGSTFVEHFKVGLGAEDATPTGMWTVKNKLKNPTYYPPRGGDIIVADDPRNPLGERWIGLEGVSGNALGQSRYGVHGTIDPDSIGKNASLGCIRLHNEDVEILFDLLIEKESTVEIRG